MNSKIVWLLAGLAGLAAVLVGAAALLFVATDSNIGIFGGTQTLDAEEFAKVQNDYLLRPDDLEVNYFIESGGEKRRGNRLIILEMKEVEGKNYVLDTGRVDGWYVNLRKSDRTDIAPSTYTNTIDIFEAKAGARLALSPEYFKAYTDDEREFEFLDENCDYGDECILYTSERFDAATGLSVIRYDVAFVYGNVLVWISATGLDVDISEEDIHEAAQIVVDKLEGFESSG